MPAVRCCSRGRISGGQFERRNTFLPANAAAVDRATAELHCRDQTFRCNVCHFVGGDRVGAGDSERIGAVESQVLKVVKAHVSNLPPTRGACNTREAYYVHTWVARLRMLAPYRSAMVATEQVRDRSRERIRERSKERSRKRERSRSRDRDSKRSRPVPENGKDSRRSHRSRSRERERGGDRDRSRREGSPDRNKPLDFAARQAARGDRDDKGPGKSDRDATRSSKHSRSDSRDVKPSRPSRERDAGDRHRHEGKRDRPHENGRARSRDRHTDTKPSELNLSDLPGPPAENGITSANVKKAEPLSLEELLRKKQEEQAELAKVSLICL